MSYLLETAHLGQYYPDKSVLMLKFNADTQNVQKSIQLMTLILIWLVLAQVSNLHETAHLWLYYPDNYVLMLDFNVWYTQRS